MAVRIDSLGRLAQFGAAAAIMALGLAAGGMAPAPAAPGSHGEGVPRYDHILVIVDENKSYDEILNPAAAPNIAGLAKSYGLATRFYGEVHPSEPNYVALVGGDTFGLRDDDAFYCRQGSTRPYCDGAQNPTFEDHTVRARHLGDQLAAAHLTWKGYYEDIPAPGSDAVIASDPKIDEGVPATALYASKHSGFINFADVQADPRRADKLVGFDQLDRDLASGHVPSFALIVPNQCNDMHGLRGAKIPNDCFTADMLALIGRGDRTAGDIVRRIQASPIWSAPGNTAIVITFDEGSGGSREGCCGVTPAARSNFGGGHIPTVVITNHGPGAVSDPTPYSHYSLLRTIEDAFRLDGYLGHAGDATGVVPMRPLFAVAK